MATLNSLLTDYETYAGYQESGSVSDAKSFITVCRKLLVKIPRAAQTGGTGGERIEIDTALIKSQLDAANQWLSSADSGSDSVRHFDISALRY